jgi:uroporphyrinogen-III synthase
MTAALAGFTVAVTADRRDDELATELEQHGARVVLVRMPHIVALPRDSAHQWAPELDPTPLQRLVDLIASRLVDAVTFSSAPAVASLLDAAGSDLDDVLLALRTDVLAGWVGPVVAEPLRRHGVPVLAPGPAPALAEALVEALPRRTRTLRIAGSELVLRGHAAVVDGILKPLPPAQMAVLRCLAASPGRVLARAELLHALPRGAGEHAVEMAVARLRAALGGTAFIQTVVKRGYRLRVD